MQYKKSLKINFDKFLKIVRNKKNKNVKVSF